VLAYLFWHRPLERSAIGAYEQALVGFHRSLARTQPVGMFGSAVFRVSDLPWLASPAGAEREHVDGAAPGYEDWYLLEDFAALGVLGEAAVGRGHRTAHDEAARRSGCGVGGLYGLLEGDRSEIGQRAAALGNASLSIWISRPPGRPPGSKQRMLGELLGDGMDRRQASLWRRQLVLGPAPEFCLLAGEPPAGVATPRLPAGWTATILEREVLWDG